MMKTVITLLTKIQRKERVSLSKSQIEKKEEFEEKTDEESFKGTLASVMMLGGFLIISWVGVWILYLVR